MHLCINHLVVYSIVWFFSLNEMTMKNFLSPNNNNVEKRIVPYVFPYQTIIMS